MAKKMPPFMKGKDDKAKGKDAKAGAKKPMPFGKKKGKK